MRTKTKFEKRRADQMNKNHGRIKIEYEHKPEIALIALREEIVKLNARNGELAAKNQVLCDTIAKLEKENAVLLNQRAWVPGAQAPEPEPTQLSPEIAAIVKRAKAFRDRDVGIIAALYDAFFTADPK